MSTGLGSHLQQRGGDAPSASYSAGAVSVPPAPTHASLGEKALGSRRSRPPLGALPLPSRAQVHLASLAQTLLADGSDVRTPGSGPSGSETAGPKAPTLSLQPEAECAGENPGLC